MENQIKVLSIREEARAGAGGRLEPHIRVDFRVGEHGPFTEYVPKAGFSPDALRQQLDTFAHQVRRLAGEVAY